MYIKNLPKNNNKAKESMVILHRFHIQTLHANILVIAHPVIEWIRLSAEVVHYVRRRECGHHLRVMP